jgi:hypothetical protein
MSVRTLGYDLLVITLNPLYTVQEDAYIMFLELFIIN